MILHKIFITNNITVPYVNIIIITVGVLILAFPQIFWFIEYGWLFGKKVGEMGVSTAIVFRIIGSLIIICGIFL